MNAGPPRPCLVRAAGDQRVRFDEAERRTETQARQLPPRQSAGRNYLIGESLRRFGSFRVPRGHHIVEAS